MKRNFSLLLIILFTSFAGLVDAITVETITLLPRQSQVFVANVRHASNTTTDNTLVIWERHEGSAERHSIWARLIAASGTPSGSLRQLVKGRNAQFADITYNPDDNQFLLVYSNETNGENRFELFAQKLNAIGKKLGKPKRISPASDRGQAVNNFSARVLYDASSQGYLILWRRYAVAAGVAIQDGLYGTVLNADLTERTAPAFMAPLAGDFTNLRGPNITDLGFHPTNGKVLITGWTQSTEVGFSFQYFLSKFDASLNGPPLKFKNLKRNLSTGAAPFAELAFLPNNNAEALFVEGTGVRKKKINAKGSPSGGDTLFFTGTVQNTPLEFPVSALATDTGRSETAVLGVDDSSAQTGSLWFQLAGSSGAALGAPFQLKTNLDITQRPAIFALPNPPASGFVYAVIYVDGPGSTASTGLVLLKVSTP